MWKSSQASRVSLGSGVSTWLGHIVRGDERNNVSCTESNERQRQRGAFSEASASRSGARQGHEGQEGYVNETTPPSPGLRDPPQSGLCLSFQPHRLLSPCDTLNVIKWKMNLFYVVLHLLCFLFPVPRQFFLLSPQNVSNLPSHLLLKAFLAPQTFRLGELPLLRALMISC